MADSSVSWRSEASAYPKGMASNRFEPLSDEFVAVQRKKRQRHSTGGASDHLHEQTYLKQPPVLGTDNLKQLPADEKLNIIIENMSNLGLLKYRIDNIESTVFMNCAHHVVSHERLRLLEYKQIDIEARSRAPNILITGVIESRDENCLEIAADIMKTRLELDPSSFVILRAYRMGRIIRPRASHLGPSPKPKPRHIMVTFSQAIEVDCLMENAFKLKGSNIGLSRDFPKEISDARKALWPRYKEARETYGPKQVKILYPAALQIKNRVVYNMFPDWYEVLRGSRCTDVAKRVSNTVKYNNDRMKEVFAHYKDQGNENVSNFQSKDGDTGNVILEESMTEPQQDAQQQSNQQVTREFSKSTNVHSRENPIQHYTPNNVPQESELESQQPHQPNIHQPPQETRNSDTLHTSEFQTNHLGTGPLPLNYVNACTARANKLPTGSEQKTQSVSQLSSDVESSQKPNSSTQGESYAEAVPCDDKESVSEQNQSLDSEDDFY